MKKQLLLLLFLLATSITLKSQTCEEYMDFVRSESYGSAYNSYNSDAISKVTFYTVSIDYQFYYFAIVCFKKQYGGCSEYIYQVDSNTKMYYSMNYLSSAGEAFWNYIEPHNGNLGCAPSF